MKPNPDCKVCAGTGRIWRKLRIPHEFVALMVEGAHSNPQRCKYLNEWFEAHVDKKVEASCNFCHRKKPRKPRSVRERMVEKYGPDYLKGSL